MGYNPTMKIETLMKEKNIKRTTARVALLEILQEADRPLCYEEIKGDIEMDRATFYRNIAKFEQEGVINAFEASDKKRYFEVKMAPHAHFVCMECSRIKCIESIEIALEGYEMSTIIVNGKCPECLEKK